MKVTANWVLQHFPFLKGLIKQGGVSGRKKLTLRVKLCPVKIEPTYHDAMVRYTSMGHVHGESFTHYAGSDASVMNNPTELVGSACPFEGQQVNPGCYYAILDLLDYYGIRDLTIYLNARDLQTASQELKNQLHQLQLPYNQPQAA